MEFLELPSEMIWDGKVEPLSPDSPLSVSAQCNKLILGNSSEYWTIEDSVIINDFLITPNEILKEDIDDSVDNFSDHEDVKIFDDLITTLNLKTEQWLNEENIDLSLMMKETEEVKSVPASEADLFPVTALFTGLLEPVMQQSSFSVQLTPPQSPPFFKNINGKHFLEQPQQLDQQHQFPHPDLQIHRETEIYDGQRLSNNIQEIPLTIDSSILFDGVVAEQFEQQEASPEIALVDELLEDKLKEFAKEDWIEDGIETDGSNMDLESGDSSSQFSSPRSETSSVETNSNYYQDQEWLPDLVNSLSQKLKKNSEKSSNSSQKKRRPYNRCPPDHEDKKSRKKEQNKNAATRYRIKKKLEIEEILEDERRLKKVNKKLNTQFGDAKRELKYLKNLLREMYKAKGILI